MQHCQFKDSAGQYCEEPAELRVIEGTKRVEHIRLSGDLDDRIVGVADCEPSNYCYYHAKLLKGMLQPDVVNMTNEEKLSYQENYDKYQRRYSHQDATTIMRPSNSH